MHLVNFYIESSDRNESETLSIFVTLIWPTFCLSECPPCSVPEAGAGHGPACQVWCCQEGLGLGDQLIRDSLHGHTFIGDSDHATDPDQFNEFVSDWF